MKPTLFRVHFRDEENKEMTVLIDPTPIPEDVWNKVILAGLSYMLYENEDPYFVALRKNATNIEPVN